jgi:sugar lactone lactonase YvrE
MSGRASSQARDAVDAGPDLVVDARASLGEGPVWDDRRRLLWWVDIEGRLVHRWSPAHGAQTPLQAPGRVGALVLRQDGGLLLAVEDALWWFDPDGSAPPARWVTLPDPKPDVRLNDGKCDPQGRFWVGTMRYDTAEGGGALYRVDRDGSVEQMLDGVTISNGLAWSADGRTMFYVDTPTRRIDAFDFDGQRGLIANRWMAVDLADEDGSPDGMTIDAAGDLWVAMWGGSAVLRCRPGKPGRVGQVIDRIAMPVRQPTSCTFGGPELNELYITSAAEGLDAGSSGPEGGLFRVHVDVAGVPASRFEQGRGG